MALGSRYLGVSGKDGGIWDIAEFSLTNRDLLSNGESIPSAEFYYFGEHQV
jgi:hypothetical protein